MKIPYLESFEDLKKYKKIYLIDNLKNISSDIEVDSLILLYPNIKIFPTNNYLNDNIKNLPLSIFNSDYTYRWKSHKDSLNFIENNLESNLINFFNIKLIKFLIKDYSDFYIKNFNCRLFEKYFFYKNIIFYFKKYNNNVLAILSEDIVKTVHNYFKNNKNKNFCNEIKLKNSFFFLRSLKFFFKTFFFLFFPFYSLIRSKKFFKHNKNTLKNFIRQYSAGFGVRYEPELSEDWIIDKKSFTKENSVFVLEEKISLEREDILKKKNYIFINANTNYPIHNLKVKNILKILYKYIPLFTFNTFTYVFSNFINRNLIYSFLRDCLIWENFCINYKKINYIYYHNYNSSHFVRNYFLNKSKSKSILYKHSFSENVFNKNFQAYCNSIYTYNHHDYEFHMAQIGLDMSLSNRSSSKFLLLSGPVWSSKEFSYKSDYIENKENILAFTSALSPHGVNSLSAHLMFLKYLKKLIKLHDKIKITVKTKYDISSYYKIDIFKKIIEEAKQTKKIFFVENKTQSRKFIDTNDIIISMPFTTPAFEALYLKKKVFFADVSNNFSHSLISTKTKNFVSNGLEDSIKMFNNYYKNKISEKVINQNAKNIFGCTLQYDPANFIRNKINEI